MNLSKRILLFLITNLAVVALVSLVLNLFGIKPYLTQTGIDYSSLLVFAAIVGFAGSFISLFMSKWMAKFSYRVRIIDRPVDAMEEHLLQRVTALAKELGIKSPEVGIYESPELNAFATGWNKNDALVAVSTGLLQNMDQDELDGVLGHEMAHVANGDMVTMALIQGVVNTFVVFIARIAAYFASQFMSGDDEQESHSPNPIVYMVTSFIFEICFGLLASIVVMWFSRYREFEADRDSGELVGKQKMIKALEKLKSTLGKAGSDPATEMATLKISQGSSIWELFSSHPQLDKRITALRSAT